MRVICYFIILFFCYGCGCIVIENSYGDTEDPELKKQFTIINHTDNEYKNNFLASLSTRKIRTTGKWTFYSPPYRQDRRINYHKLSTIKSQETIVKNQKDEFLELEYPRYCDITGDERVFLFSLDSGSRKIFFGATDHYQGYKAVYRPDHKRCEMQFLKWYIYPTWQNKELTIHIYDDRIAFSDAKIKEVKKLKLTDKEEVDPNTLALVDSKCD